MHHPFSLVRCVALLFALAGPAWAQGLRIRSLSGVLAVDVGTADATVEVSVVATGATTSHAVAPDKTVAVHGIPPGSLVVVSVGTGRRRHVVLVEVIAP